MARKPRAELEGGLYHLMTWGNNRQDFNSHADYQRFLSQMAVQKVKLPLFIYANGCEHQGTVGNYWD